MWLALQSKLRTALRELWTLTKLLAFVLVLLLAWGIAHSPPLPRTKPEAAVFELPSRLSQEMPRQLIAVLRFYTDNKHSAQRTG